MSYQETPSLKVHLADMAVLNLILTGRCTLYVWVEIRSGLHLEALALALALDVDF